MPVLTSQNLVESCISLNENHVHFSILSPNFFLSFDISLSCKPQLIDLIMVSAACLDGKLKTQLDAF